MNGLGLRLQGVYEQASAVVMEDIAYVCGVWSGDVLQGNANQINERNARLTLMFVRAVTGTYMTYLAFASLKTVVKLPCMSAFSFLDDVLPLFLKIVVSYNLFRTSLNLANTATLSNGVIAGYLAPLVELAVADGQNAAAPLPDQEVPNQIAFVLNPYVTGTIFPSIWNSLVLYCLNRGIPAQQN
jgi:hypothetical protein